MVLLLAACNFLLGIAMDRLSGGKRKLLFLLALGIDLGVLCFYKYADFFLTSVGLPRPPRMCRSRWASAFSPFRPWAI